MMRALKTILAAAWELLRKWRVLAVLATVYAALLTAVFFFVTTKEATTWQVILTLVFAATVPALFFLLQAMIVNYARGEAKAIVLLRRSFRDSCKLALASLPLALLAVIFLYLMNKLQPDFPVNASTARAAQDAWSMEQSYSSLSLTPSPSWSLLTFSTLRFLFFGIILPLGVIHLWGATLRDGLIPAIKRMPHNLARAFASDSLLVYSIGLILFGLVPYVLLFIHTPGSSPTTAFSLFIARLFLVFIFTLYGWTVTIAALAVAGNVTRADTSDSATS